MVSTPTQLGMCSGKILKPSRGCSFSEKIKAGFSEEVTDTEVFQEEQVTFQKEKEDVSGKERRRYKVSFRWWLWKS